MTTGPKTSQNWL